MKWEKFLIDFDSILDAKYGKQGTISREHFRKEAEAYCLNNKKNPRKLKKKIKKERLKHEQLDRTERKRIL